MSLTLEEFGMKFRRFANGIVARYGGAVWLVGGALTDPDPRDYDVRVVLSLEDAVRLYGRDLRSLTTFEDGRLKLTGTAFPFDDYRPWEWKRAYDDMKRSRNLSSILGLPIDFQTQLEIEAQPYVIAKMPRLRLDSAPLWMRLEGLL